MLNLTNKERARIQASLDEVEWLKDDYDFGDEDIALDEEDKRRATNLLVAQAIIEMYDKYRDSDSSEEFYDRLTEIIDEQFE